MMRITPDRLDPQWRSIALAVLIAAVVFVAIFFAVSWHMAHLGTPGPFHRVGHRLYPGPG